MSGKGGKRRQQQASDEEVQASWDRIFGKCDKEEEKEGAHLGPFSYFFPTHSTSSPCRALHSWYRSAVV